MRISPLPPSHLTHWVNLSTKHHSISTDSQPIEKFMDFLKHDKPCLLTSNNNVRN